MIPRRNISQLVLKLSTADQIIQEKTVEKDYILSWVLAGLAQTDLKDILAFKGGTALKKIYFQGYRFSEDLDFSLIGSHTPEEIKALFAKAFQSVLTQTNLNLSFALDKDSFSENTFTFFLNYSGPLGADPARRQVKMDITLKELILLPLENKLLLREYPEYSDLPADAELKVYALAEIFIEKLCCLLDPKRNEPRDVYDTWYLLGQAGSPSFPEEVSHLGQGFKKKAAFKILNSLDLSKTINNKEARYRKSWDLRFKDQVIDLPDFDRVYRELKKHLRRHGYLT